jgi:short-subunit dehydrogenase
MSKSVAVITGASQGIGRATAIRLSRDFSALALVARNRPNLEETAEKVRADGAEALVIDADMARPEMAQAVVDQARSTRRSSPWPRRFPTAASPMACRSTASCPARS